MYNEIIHLANVSLASMHNPTVFATVCGIMGALAIATYYRIASI